MANREKLVPRVLRVCSVFEAPPSALSGRGARFDPVGGMQNHTAQLTRALDRLGVRQVVITHRPPGAPRLEHLSAGVAIHRFGLAVPWLRQLFSVPAAFAALRVTSEVDLVHAHQGEDLAVLPIGLAAARAARIPLVVTLHTSLRHGFFAPGLRGDLLVSVGGTVESAVCARADAVISLSARLKVRLRQSGVAPERIHVIPPGVNSSEFASDSSDPFPELSHPRVVFVGRLVPQKGVETLLEAATLMRRAEAQIVLVGDGPLRPEIEASIRARGLQDRVRVTGFRSHLEIPSVLRHSDVFCLPSRYEELSSALLEAMYAGLPIVASSVGAVPEALDGAGRLVAPADPSSLAQAIDEILSDADLAARLGAAARERSRTYEWSELAKQVLDVYGAALQARAHAGQAAAGAAEASRST